MGGRLL